MKLNFHHSGLQFFFITITMIRRRKLLSRLIDEKHRPELLPLGELVKAALVAFHGAFPAATISDFIIMPDHIHFLLIANYAIDPRFNPLWASHRLIDVVEMAWNGRGQAPEPTPPLALHHWSLSLELCVIPKNAAYVRDGFWVARRPRRENWERNALSNAVRLVMRPRRAFYAVTS